MIKLLRHAESRFNAFRVNEKDCSLSEKGYKQAAQLSGHFDIVLRSPLRRCIETLEYSKITFDKLIVLPIMREYKVDPSDFFENEEIIKETEEAVNKRIKEFKIILQETVRDNPNKSILCVGHSYIFKFLTNSEFWLENACIMDYDPTKN